MPKKLMRDLILEALEDSPRQRINIDSVMDHCLKHSVELSTPLSPIMHRDEIMFYLLNDIDDLEAQGLIRVGRFKGFIQHLEKIGGEHDRAYGTD
jgi:hypothetical protein